MKTIVVSPIGEPGAGKSTFSMWLAHYLKVNGINTEFVPEVIKYESYDSEDIKRVVSGKFDFRLLTRQHAMTKPLVGKVEVIVNDGALPPFFYYSLLRVDPMRLPALRERLDQYLMEQQPAEHRYVTVKREHEYESVGRRQNEEESIRLRHDLLETLDKEFEIQPLLLGSWDERRDYADRLIEEVMEHRMKNKMRRSLHL